MDSAGLVDDPLARSELPAVEVAQFFLDRIESSQSVINACITITAERALEDARRVDLARQAGTPLPLDGMPIVVKDNIDVAGIRTTVGSRLFENNVATRDAEVVHRLRSAGAVILAKTNLHELAYGTTSRNAAFGPVRNPWDLERIAGGSSGGSGAALGADLCVGALGSDTGGSVRIPAALTGVSGLRPTSGSVSNRGSHSLCWTFDTIGPMARCVEDVWRLLPIMAAFDPADPRCVERPVQRPPKRLGAMRIGVPEDDFFKDVDGEIEAAVRAARDVFTDLGADVRSISLPGAGEATRICNLIIRADALALYRVHLEEQPDRISEDIRDRLKLGAQVGGAELASLLQGMFEWRATIREMFAGIDVLLTPTTDRVAPTIESAQTLATTAVLTRLTYPWSLAHLPALSIPCGLSASGLPIGLQIVAAPWDEPCLYQLGVAFQQVTDWHRKRPLPLRSIC